MKPEKKELKAIIAITLVFISGIIFAHYASINIKPCTIWCVGIMYFSLMIYTTVGFFIILWLNKTHTKEVKQNE